MQHRVLSCLGLIVLMMAACQPKFITVNDLHRLEKGMTAKAVNDVLSRDADDTKQFVVDGTRYFAELYPLETSQDKKQERTQMLGSQRERITNVTTHYVNTFVLLYDGRGLRYWGMLGDFDKSEDADIRALSSRLYLAIGMGS